MLASIAAATLTGGVGLTVAVGRPASVEVHVSNGLPGWDLHVGVRIVVKGS
jgi:hypothetical protein